MSGWDSTLEEQPVPAPKPKREPAPKQKRKNGSKAPLSPEERARLYIAKADPSIQGDNGSGKLFYISQKAVHGFGLDDATATQVIVDEFNPRCDPEWSREEIERAVARARDKSRVNMEIVPDRPLDETEDDSPDPTDEDAPDAPPKTSAASCEARPGRHGGDEPPAEPPTADDPLRGLKHLGPIALVGRERMLAIAAVPVSYAWDGIAPDGTIVVVAGPSGEGKTTTLFLLVAARLSRAPIMLLGHRVTPAPAGTFFVLIEGEHSEGSTVRLLVKSLALLGVPDDALDRLILVARKSVLLGSPEWLDVVTLCALGLVSDIALDTLARTAPADANDEAQQVEIYNMMAQAIEKAPEGNPKPNVWAVLHTRKGTTGGLADVSGSVQRVGQADSVIMVAGEKIGGRVVSSTLTFEKLREAPDPYPEPVTFFIEKDPDGKPYIRTSTGETGAMAADDRPLEERIVDVLRGGPQTKAALAKTLGRSWKAVDEAISILFASRSIRTGAPKKINNREFPTFELRTGFGGGGRAHPANDFDDAFEDGETPKSGVGEHTTRAHDSHDQETTTRPARDQ